MEPDKANDSAAQAKGSIKEAIGKVTGDPRIEAAGSAEKAEAKDRNPAAEASDKPNRD